MSSDPFEIEEVRDMDAVWPEVEALVLGIIEYHQPIDPRPLRQDWSIRMRSYMEPGADALTLLARESGDTVAFLNGRVWRDHGIFDEVYAYIDNAFVRQDARGQGVGRALLARFESWSRRRGAANMRLNVSAANELGLTFWTRAGFRITDHAMAKSLRAGRD
jgi:GNAT superfamily N-acetyltransferase